MIKVGLPKGGIKAKSMELIKNITGTEIGEKNSILRMIYLRFIY